ncbi:MAG: Asp-tRNA(Asn)/Glu-tRNA(Gln) amidotransferase GatCAB subunit C, partial [Ignavibacterium sp.]
MFEDRTYCGNINVDHIDKSVQLNGWVDAIRDHGYIIFIHLRDISGIVQLVFDSNDSKELYDNAVQLKEEYIIEVKGKVRKRTAGTENPNIKTG